MYHSHQRALLLTGKAQKFPSSQQSLTSGGVWQVVAGLLALAGAGGRAGVVGGLHELHLLAGRVLGQGHLQAAEVQPWGDDLHAGHVPPQPPPVLQHRLQLRIVAASRNTAHLNCLVRLRRAFVKSSKAYKACVHVESV